MDEENAEMSSQVMCWESSAAQKQMWEPLFPDQKFHLRILVSRKLKFNAPWCKEPVCVCSSNLYWTQSLIFMVRLVCSNKDKFGFFVHEGRLLEDMHML